jgi:hypothetical protein
VTPHVYVPFLDPLPIWLNDWIWPALLIPLCLALSIVYKSIRCKTMDRVPKEALGLFLMIVFGMIAAALALAGLAKWMD